MIDLTDEEIDMKEEWAKYTRNAIAQEMVRLIAENDRIKAELSEAKKWRNPTQTEPCPDLNLCSRCGFSLDTPDQARLKGTYEHRICKCDWKYSPSTRTKGAQEND